MNRIQVYNFIRARQNLIFECVEDINLEKIIFMFRPIGPATSMHKWFSNFLVLPIQASIENMGVWS